MKINNTYNLGDTVYLTTDPEQSPRLITSIVVNFGGIQYGITYIDDETYHFEQHLSKDKNVF